TLDTTQATTDAGDASLNADCGAPATEASVWYSYTASADGAVVIDVSQSSYSAGVIVATGTPGSLFIDACGPGAVAETVTAGETVYIMAFDDTPGSGNGGTLQISVDNAPPPPDLSVTVDPVGSFNSHTGVATISGSVTCTGGDFVILETDLRQKVGRVAITGFGTAELPCDGTYRWSIGVLGDNGRFGGGKVATVEFSFACGAVFCSQGFSTQTVALKSAKK
ncbi:MAG: hypothetical protein QOE53_1887, partial [Pseudonocardiales bacterium]|nr:hypothetical protein [Pseudonocardiales bacterium]